MQLSHFRPIIALATFFLGVSIALYATFVWERHVSTVNHVGENLAQWANLHDVTILINGKPISRKEYSGCAFMKNGFTEVFITMFYPAKPAGPTTPEWKNLSSTIQRSGWRTLRLPQEDEIKNTPPEQLAEDLRPLGQLEFVSVYQDQ
jgi:hypothetical protein